QQQQQPKPKPEFAAKARVVKLEKENAELNEKLLVVEGKLETKAAAAKAEEALLNKRILELRRSQKENMTAAGEEFASLTRRLEAKDKETRETDAAHAKELRERDAEIARLVAESPSGTVAEQLKEKDDRIARLQQSVERLTLSQGSASAGDAATFQAPSGLPVSGGSGDPNAQARKLSAAKGGDAAGLRPGPLFLQPHERSRSGSHNSLASSV
ncbi:unnamed protein product, partial [Scytosiphon promiscuus]